MFTSERGTPFTVAGFARMIERAGTEAELGFKAHPHMLRHACGYALANKGMIRGRCKLTWVTRIFSTRSGTRNCRLPGSRIFGATKTANKGRCTPNSRHSIAAQIGRGGPTADNGWLLTFIGFW